MELWPFYDIIAVTDFRRSIVKKRRFNILDKIINKLMDVGVEMLFSGINTSALQSSVSGSGFLSSVVDMFGFAKGGAFTNGVYNQPTPFAFAGGGSFGVMGEAGPEAVMPLQRGSDGSLGVRAVNGNEGGNVFININNNAQGTQASVQQRQTSQGVEIDVMIDQMVADKMNQQGSYSNRSLNNFANRQLIRRG